MYWGFPGVSDSKESACSAGDPASIPGLGRSPGEGNGYPFQRSCLENSMMRGAWCTTVHGVAESDMTEATEHVRVYSIYVYINRQVARQIEIEIKP